MPSIEEIEVIAPHFKRRLSGVTSTLIQLLPRQVAAGVRIAALGPGLPAYLPKLSFRQLIGLWRSPAHGEDRIWHARRNIEMLAGIVLRDIARMKLKLLFTSAAQRHHSGYTRWLISTMDAVVATSARSGGFLQIPHTVVMHGIDTTLFHPDAMAKPPRRIIGCSGRIRHQKGTDLFVASMLLLLPRFPVWDAEITGRVTADNRAFADALMEKIRAAGLADRIRFLGEIDDIKPWYRKLSLFVAPSRNEGFGLTPLEAMASGAAVVTSDAGAYAEMVVDGETGRVVPADDGDALTSAIERFLSAPDIADKHGMTARQHVVTHFELAREVEGLSRVYDQMLRPRFPSADN